MGIFMRGKKWYVDVPDGKGRRIRRSVGPSKDVADLVHKDLQVKIAKYLGIFETATTPFSEYAKDWLAKRKPTLKPSTYRDYSSIMEVYAIPHLGETPIGKVSRRDVEIFFDKLPHLTGKRKNNIMVLIKGIFDQARRRDDKWGEQFAEFIIRLVGDNQDPTLIEIHPPFVSYCKNVDSFLDIYGEFTSSLRVRIPKSIIVIENRNGTRHSSKFLVSTVGDVVTLFAAVERRGIDLKLALDLPQIFSAHLGSKPPTPLEVEHLLEKLRPVAHHIETFHIWGRRKTAHNGTLDDLFGHDPLAKEALFDCLRRLLEDPIPSGHPAGAMPPARPPPSRGACFPAMLWRSPSPSRNSPGSACSDVRAE